MTKLFDSMASLKFEQADDKDTKMAVGMFSKDGEYVDFAQKCDCDGQVLAFSFYDKNVILV